MAGNRKLPVGGIALALSGGAVIAAVGAVMLTARSPDVAAPANETPAMAAVPAPDGSPIGPEATVSIQSAPQTPETRPAGQEGDIDYSDNLMSFTASFPAEPAGDVVMSALRAEAQRMLAQAKKDAATAAAERGQGSSIPWEYQLEWQELARSGGIVSLVGTYYAFTGGAHGMTSTATHIADLKTGQEIAFGDMMRYGKTPSPAVVIAVCEALKKEKLARIDSATVMDEPIVCAGPNANVRLVEANVALAPSSEPDKFGGLYVYFDPYVVGAYAEGSYAVAVQQEVFSHDLKPAYQNLFAGTAPAPGER